MKNNQYYDYNYKATIHDVLFTPTYGVKLNKGLFHEIFYNNINFLKTLNLGSMMYHFDIKAGRTPTAEPYRGHFEDNLKGSTLSMSLMGAANTLRWASDKELEQSIRTLYNCLVDSMEPDGFLMPINKCNFAHREYPHYVRIWLNYALCAVATGYDEKAYDVLRKWQDWFNTCPDLPIIRYLELAFQGIVASTYVYFTPAGKEKDIQVARQYYEEPWRLAQFMRREDNAVEKRIQPGSEPHAHGSELESIEGYLDLYRATGANYYLTAVLGAWDLYHDHWQHVGGGIVMCEGEEDNHPDVRWISPKHNYNELCCTAFWININQRFHRLFPEEEKYVAEIEKSIFNIAIANQEGALGIRYFAYMEEQKMEPGQVHCCCGAGTRIFASLPEYIFTINEDTLSIDLYTNAEIDWQHHNTITKIRTQGEVPFNKDIHISIATENKCNFTLALRMPGWLCEDVNVFVNGNLIGTGVAGSYFHINRTWSDNDVVTFTLNPDFKFTKYEGEDGLPPFNRYGIEYGPLLMAVTGEHFETARNIGWSLSDFKDYLKEVPSHPLEFNIISKKGYKLVPYFSINKEEFSCYPIFND